VRVQCHLTGIELSGDYSAAGIPSVRATCSRCGRKTKSYGRSPASVRRCLVLMRRGCPRDESNFYVADEDENAWDEAYDEDGDDGG
jgi:hypothetical protein